ncbi:MAG: transporter substrate-binding domain-containing protein [Deltaproteobacteria bacterium]|nr:transporter substrate-binding domain-containing protein [Deltaproteobacteria bacterium]
MRRIPLLLILTIIFYLGCNISISGTIRIATLNWEPYVGEDLKEEGFLAHITREAFKRAGYKIEFLYRPWKRAVVKAEEGDFDGYFPAYFSKERMEKSYFTDKIISGPMGFFKLKYRNITYKKIEDLKPYRIGIVRGYVNTKEFDNADYIRKEAVVGDETNFRKLLMKRIDLAIADKFVGYSIINRNPKMKGKINFLNPPLKDLKLYICISKNTTSAQKKLKAFNKGLKEIIKDGTFKRILVYHNIN